MTRVFWDTNLFIYLLEDHPVFGEPARALRRRHQRRGDQIVTSWMTVAKARPCRSPAWAGLHFRNRYPDSRDDTAGSLTVHVHDARADW